jgi:hypothetical protein
VTVESAGKDRVRSANAGGHERPAKLKVTVGFDGGFHAEAGVSYAGPGAAARATMAAEIVRQRMKDAHGVTADLRVDVIGVSSLFATAGQRTSESQDVRVHAAMRTTDRSKAELMLWEVESLLCCGPAGGGGYRGSITPAIMTKSVLIGRDKVRPRVELFTA